MSKFFEQAVYRSADVANRQLGICRRREWSINVLLNGIESHDVRVQYAWVTTWLNVIIAFTVDLKQIVLDNQRLELQTSMCSDVKELTGGKYETPVCRSACNTSYIDYVIPCVHYVSIGFGLHSQFYRPRLSRNNDFHAFQTNGSVNHIAGEVFGNGDQCKWWSQEGGFWNGRSFSLLQNVV